jgi:hypothetical protein
MKRRITIWTICFVALIVWTGLAFAQTAKPGAIKTIKLANGEEVCDLTGEWDALIENYGQAAVYGTYTNSVKITQVGNSFTGVRLKDNPPESPAPAGSEFVRGEIDKDGFKKVELVSGSGGKFPGKGQIIENGNKMIVDCPQRVMVSFTRK